MKTDFKAIIKSKGYKTLTEFAKQAGITKQTLNGIVNGNPTISTLEEIADTIGCTLPELLTIEPQHPTTLTCPKCGAKLSITINEEES